MVRVGNDECIAYVVKRGDIQRQGAGAVLDGYSNCLFVVRGASGDDRCAVGDGLDAFDSDRADERDDRGVLQLFDGGICIERWPCSAVLL